MTDATLKPDATVTYAFGCTRCRYRTVPEVFNATPYDRCPLCGGPWVLNPPPLPPRPQSQPKPRGGAR